MTSPSTKTSRSADVNLSGFLHVFDVAQSLFHSSPVEMVGQVSSGALQASSGKIGVPSQSSGDSVWIVESDKGAVNFVHDLQHSLGFF